MRKWLVFMVLFCLSWQVTAQPREPLLVALDWYINPDHAALIIAQEKGFFAEQGLSVQLIAPSDPADPPKWVAAKKADIGLTYEPEFMQQVDAGLPVIHFGTLIDRPLDCLAILQENSSKTLADLKGKRIGLRMSGSTSAMLKVMLSRQGLKMQDVTLINVRYNLMQALLAHQVDAVTGFMRNIEVPELEMSGHPLRIFLPEENGIPSYSELILITHSDAQGDKRLPRFLTALHKAVIYLQKHPEEGWQRYIHAYPEANNALNRRSWFATIPLLAREPATAHAHDWQSFARFMHEQGLIHSVQPLCRYSVIFKKDNVC